MRRLLFLIWKELLELRQDKRMLPIVFVAPILQLIVLGYAATTDVQNVPVIVADADRSAASRDLVQRFEGSPYFTVTSVVSNVNEVVSNLEDGRAWMALSIPVGYGQKVGAGRPTAVQVVADGTDANSTNIALGYASTLVAGYAQELAFARVPGGRPPGGLQADVRVWFNPQLESKFFMIPGVLAILLIVMTIVLASMGIVREKELGTLEQLNVTPLRRWELIVGKLLPYGLIGAVDIFLVTGVAVLWFKVPLLGSFPLLFCLSLVFLLSTLGLGLFVSTISDNQQQAMMTAVFFFLTPMIYLSGFVFPIENMPAAIQPLTYLIPLRYYLVIVRGIFLKGVGLDVLWPQALALLVWGVAILGLATLRSTKRAT
ncbi:MAG TPA: ABC transporter permease [Vicinamibacterales bacterium]|jgi:ABC-2 type transport system permease protein